MEFEAGYLLALIVVGLSFLGFTLSMMIDEVNKKKGIVVFILSLILFLLGAYYYTVVGTKQIAAGERPNLINRIVFLYQETPAPVMIPVPQNQ